MVDQSTFEMAQCFKNPFAVQGVHLVVLLHVLHAVKWQQDCLLLHVESILALKPSIAKTGFIPPIVKAELRGGAGGG